MKNNAICASNAKYEIDVNSEQGTNCSHLMMVEARMRDKPYLLP